MTLTLSRRATIAGLAASLLAAKARARGIYADHRNSPVPIIVRHFFGYGQSLEEGFHATPPLSTTQPFDNLMFGTSPRTQSAASTIWTPIGTAAFNPLIAVNAAPRAQTADGEVPGVAWMNYARGQWLAAGNGVTELWVYTSCGVGGKTLAQLLPGASPCYYNRLLTAAQAVKQATLAAGMQYMVGDVIFVHGQQDALKQVGTTAATYMAQMQTLMAAFDQDVTCGIVGAPAGTKAHWFSLAPAPSEKGDTIAVCQAQLNLALMPGTQFHLAGTVYPYPNYVPHQTANSARWSGLMAGKCMVSAWAGVDTLPLYMTGAVYDGSTITVRFHVPSPPLRVGEVWAGGQSLEYPNGGFIVSDGDGMVPMSGPQFLSEGSSLAFQPSRLLVGPATIQAGYNILPGIGCGTNICDSDPTIAFDTYQPDSFNVATWNGAPLIGQPYPLNNYCAVGAIAVEGT